MFEASGLITTMGTRYLGSLRSQYWSEPTRRRYVTRHLARTLNAALRIPFYRTRYGRDVGILDFSSLPVVERGEIRELNASVRSLHPPATRFAADRSSGSTGLPVEFLFDAAHQAGRFACRARYLTQNGWHPLMRTAWIVPLPGQTPDGRLMRKGRLLGSRFLSLFTPVDAQIEWLVALDPHFVYSLPSNLELLADTCAARGIRLPSLRKVFSGGEVLEEAHRRKVRQAWDVGIADNYGSTEGFMAWDCPFGGRHINAEHVLVEVLDDRGNSAAPGMMGRIVITTLENHLMPLVRYAIGDYGIMSCRSACQCGRTLPLLDAILGRSINMFRLTGDRVISPWEIVVRLKYLPSVSQFQIIQKSADRFVFRARRVAPLSDAHRSAVTAAFVDVLGPHVEVDFEQVEEIPRAASGKFMTALSEVSGGVVE